MVSRSVIKSDFTYKEVLSHQPPKLTSGTPESMNELIKAQSENPDFQIAEIVRNFTGLAEVEVQRLQEEIERKALEELKSVQEQAYAQAYELGLEDGRKKAFAAHSEVIEKKMSEMEHILESFRNAKKYFLDSNENQLVKMVFYLSKKIAMFEISSRSQEAILSVLNESIKSTFDDEAIRVMVSPDQFEFLSMVQKEKGRKLEFLKNVEFIAQEGIQSGGCTITSNYSEIDARIEERVSRLWDEIQLSIPPIKDEVV